MIINQRLIFVSLAGFYCVCLGVFALVQDPKSKVNRLFASYNFFNALWNVGDFVVLFKDLGTASIFLKFADLGSCFCVTFILHFIYEFIGISQQKPFKEILKLFYFFSFVFSFLNFFSLISRSSFVQVQNLRIIQEVPGPYLGYFAVFLLLGLGCAIFPLPFLFRKAKGYRRRQIAYVVLACSVGAVGLGSFFVSLYVPTFPLAYHFQAAVGFIFSYAIFKHNLLSIRVALRRASLIIGIYVVIGGVLVPISYLYFQQFLGMDKVQFASFVIFMTVVGVLFSLGPLVYAFMVKRSALFQDETTQHITHEFKSPLGAIQNAREIVEDELKKPRPDGQIIEDYLGMIQRNSQRLEKFVVEILDFARIGEGYKPLMEIVPVDLAVLAREVVGLFPQLTERVRFDNQEPIVVHGSPEGLRLILTNLLSNAEKYAPSGPIRLEIKKETKHVEISVEDNGKGIDGDDLERIFDPFVQGKSSEKGSGLGLAIVKKWVHFHGGKIWAESKGLNLGAKFNVVLPL